MKESARLGDLGVSVKANTITRWWTILCRIGHERKASRQRKNRCVNFMWDLVGELASSRLPNSEFASQSRWLYMAWITAQERYPYICIHLHYFYVLHIGCASDLHIEFAHRMRICNMRLSKKRRRAHD
jgi:hypothetical protein